MKRFYHVLIYPKPGISVAEVEKVMNLALDWFRHNENVWILYSSAEIAKWQARLKPLVEPEGSLFICELNINNRNGWMVKKFWEWLRSKNVNIN